MNLPPFLLSLVFAVTAVSAQTTNPPPSTTPTNSAFSVGEGSYLTSWDGRTDAAIPDNRDVQTGKFITSNLANQPIPTNSWWSSIIWAGTNKPWANWGDHGNHNVSYAHPFALKPEVNGMRLYSPSLADYWAVDYAFVGTMPAPAIEWKNGQPVPLEHTVYFKELDFVVGNTAASGSFVTRAHDYSDWFVTARMESGSASMDFTFGHGSPYVFAVYNKGKPTLQFATHSTAPVNAKNAEIWSGSASSRVIGFSVEDRDYAAFAPQGTTWSGLGTEKIIANLPAGKKYFSVAAVPSRDKLALMEKYAYNHVTSSQVSWNYRGSDSKLLSTYAVTTRNYPESSGTGSLMGLYPHQWRKLSSGARLTGDSYFTPRGYMKLAEGSSFTTAITYHGVIPAMPEVKNTADKTRLSSLVENVRKEVFNDRDTYYTGKRLGKVATLISLAQQSGNAAAEKQFMDELKWRLEGWLKADVIDDLEPSPFAKNLFYYNSDWGTMLGIDGSFGSLKELNDHHFHYGYFVRAAAEIARNDASWASQHKFGGMVELLIRDYGNWERPRATATTERGKMFPFLRNFDIYAGHSWASGHARFGAGNNNESSSEAMNAWTAMILWGEETGNTALRNAGVYLYTTEMTAIQEYWNNVYEDNYHPTYNKPMASLIWGGKTDYATWFSPLPEAMHGIILLPIQSGSLYLGLFPDNVKKNYEFLSKNLPHFRMWDAIFYAYQATYDPTAALANFNSNEGRMVNSVAGPSAHTEVGNSLANTFAWIKTFQQYGRIDKDVVAINHPTYAVFSGGTDRTYVVYNASENDSKNVRFNDGTQVNVGPGEMEVYTASIEDPQTPPDAPVLSSAQAQDGAVTLKWQATNRTTGYRVTYGLVSGKDIATVDAGSAAELTVNNLNNGTNYYIKVRAYNSYGDSDTSNTLHVTPVGSLSSSSSAVNSSASSVVKSSASSVLKSSVSSVSSVPNTAGAVQINSLGNGSVQFSIRLPEQKNRVHLFSRRNGLQDYVVNDLQIQPGGQENNGDGTYTYKASRAGIYANGDVIESRFYTYTPTSGQIFYPGPGEASWTRMTYRDGESLKSSSSNSVGSSASSNSSVASSVGLSSSSSASGYSTTAVLPNGAAVAYTTTASYANGAVKITFSTAENLNWVWCFTPDWNEMKRIDSNLFEITIPNQTPSMPLSYYFTVSTATRGEGNNNSAQHRWSIQ